MLMPAGPYRPPAELFPAAWHVFLRQQIGVYAGPARVLSEVLDLHRPVRVTWRTEPICEGCELAGSDPEHPDWPCRTVTLIAETLGHPIRRRCPTCAHGAHPTYLHPVYPDGRLVTHVCPHLVHLAACPSSLTAGLLPGQEGP